MGIEPTSSAWKAEVLPLNYTRPISNRFLPPNQQSCFLYVLVFFKQPSYPDQNSNPPANWWREEDSNLRRLSQQIYSLPPLTAREPLRKTKTLILKLETNLNFADSARCLVLTEARQRNPHKVAFLGVGARFYRIFTLFDSPVGGFQASIKSTSRYGPACDLVFLPAAIDTRPSTFGNRC